MNLILLPKRFFQIANSNIVRFYEYNDIESHMSIAIDNGMTLFVIGCGSSKWYDLIIDMFHRKKCTNCFVISLCPNQYHGNEHDKGM